MYQQTRLYDHSAIGAPGALPGVIAAWDGAISLLADLTGHVDPQFGFDGTGFWPVIVSAATFDPTAQMLTGGITGLAVDVADKQWIATQAVRPLTSAELSAAQATLVTYANTKQWGIATGGFTTSIGGAALTFETDADSYALMTGKAVRLGQANPPTTINWQFGSGNFVTLQAADFMTAAIKIADFVQATFDALKTVLAAISAGSIKTTAQVDAAAWPATTG